MTTRFAITRADGRSNTEVLIDTVGDTPPGTIHRYEDLAAALAVGASHSYSIAQVQRIVACGLRQLGRRCKRTLECIPGVGYRVAYAREHLGLAVRRQDRANSQLRKGLSLLQDVRFEEMDANTRKAHEAQLLIVSSIYQQQTALEARLSRNEQAIADLLSRTSQAG